MKILFLCGSLELGRDGVGDYTRRLAGELIRQGHQAAIIALNDRHVEFKLDEKQEIETISVLVLRLPSSMSANERFVQAENYIQEFNPKWLSLQYVPFSFQDKGLPIGLGRKLARIGKGRNWHVMFHELWVGMNVEASFKLKIWGIIQREITSSILKQLRPLVIHTQSKLFLFCHNFHKQILLHEE